LAQSLKELGRARQQVQVLAESGNAQSRQHQRTMQELKTLRDQCTRQIAAAEKFEQKIAETLFKYKQLVPALGELQVGGGDEKLKEQMQQELNEAIEEQKLLLQNQTLITERSRNMGELLGGGGGPKLDQECVEQIEKLLGALVDQISDEKLIDIHQDFQRLVMQIADPMQKMDRAHAMTMIRIFVKSILQTIEEEIESNK